MQANYNYQRYSKINQEHFSILQLTDWHIYTLNIVQDAFDD